MPSSTGEVAQSRVVASIVGTARTASAMGKIVEALAIELEIAELESAE